MSLQFDLFEPELDEFDLLRADVKSCKDSQDKLRKGLFARHHDMSKLVIELKEEIHALRHQLVLVARNKV